MEARIAETTDHKMQQMRAQAAAKQDEAVNMLLKLVTNINPELHVNFHPNQKKWTRASIVFSQCFLALHADLTNTVYGAQLNIVTVACH